MLGLTRVHRSNPAYHGVVPRRSLARLASQIHELVIPKALPHLRLHLCAIRPTHAKIGRCGRRNKYRRVSVIGDSVANVLRISCASVDLFFFIACTPSVIACSEKRWLRVHGYNAPRREHASVAGRCKFVWVFHVKLSYQSKCWCGDIVEDLTDESQLIHRSALPCRRRFSQA